MYPCIPLASMSTHAIYPHPYTSYWTPVTPSLIYPIATPQCLLPVPITPTPSGKCTLHWTPTFPSLCNSSSPLFTENGCFYFTWLCIVFYTLIWTFPLFSHQNTSILNKDLYIISPPMLSPQASGSIQDWSLKGINCWLVYFIVLSI